MSKKDSWGYDEFLEAYTHTSPDELLGLVAHDVRNQLSTIIGYLELIRYDFNQARLSEDDKKLFVETMLARANTIQELIDATVTADKHHRSANGTHE